MKYYKARYEAYDYFNKRGVIAGELLTTKERERLVRYIDDFCFEIVEIPKTRVYRSFGHRFECKGDCE